AASSKSLGAAMPIAVGPLFGATDSDTGTAAGTEVSIVSASAVDTGLISPSASVSVAVSDCAPAPSGTVTAAVQIPPAPTTPLPTTAPLAERVTVSPTSPDPVTTGVVLLVRLSPRPPLSDPVASASPVGAVGPPAMSPTAVPPEPSELRVKVFPAKLCAG